MNTRVDTRLTFKIRSIKSLKIYVKVVCRSCHSDAKVSLVRSAGHNVQITTMCAQNVSDFISYDCHCLQWMFFSLRNI